MIKKRNLFKNNHALSVMYDAVFFIVLVSLSGAVLLPAMMNPTAVQSSVDRHREQLVDETLLMLMTSRDPEFNYTFAGEQIHEILGDVANTTILSSIIDGMLKRELLHKTYADLITENLASQLSIFGNQTNFFTNSYTTNLKETLHVVIQNHLGNKYHYNLSASWQPIQGIPIGGHVSIGLPPPKKDIYVAKASAAMPSTQFTQWIRDAETIIQEKINSIGLDNWLENFLITYDPNNPDLDEVYFVLTQNITIIIEGILFDGLYTFDEFGFPGLGYISITDKIVTYVFSLILSSIQNIFDSALETINNIISEYLPIDLSNEIESLFITVISNIIQYLDEDFEITGNTIQHLIDDLKTLIKDKAKQSISWHLQTTITTIVTKIVTEHIEPLLESEENEEEINKAVEIIQEKIKNLFKERTNVLHSEFTLILWEA